MTVPQYISEDSSEMRAVKPGWYAMEDDGDLSSGPFSSHAECLDRMTRPLSTEHACQHFDLATAQNEEPWAPAEKTAAESAKPISLSLTKAFNRLA